MSILVWQEADGTLYQGRLMTNFMADLICNGARVRYFPGSRRVAYRVRIKERRP